MKTKMVLIVSIVLLAIACGCAKKPAATELDNTKVLETMKLVNKGLEDQIAMLKANPQSDPNSGHVGTWVVDGVHDSDNP